MRKTLVLLASFCLLPAIGQPQEAQSPTIIENWRCLNAMDRFALLFGGGGYDDIPDEMVVVTLTRRSSKDDKSGFGDVSITGITHRARFSVEGLERRWDFGENDKYSFIIDPQGDGAYYDFSNAEEGERVQPSLEFSCVSDHERKEEKPERLSEVDEAPSDLPHQDMGNSNLDVVRAGKMADFNLAEDDYLPIVKVAPMYPRRAQSRGLEGYCDLEFTVTPLGTTADVSVIECTSSLFERASVQALLKFKYKPRVVNGTAIAVPRMRHRIMFQMEGTERRRREDELAERIRQEMEGERRRQAGESGELDDYKARIRQRIESNWIRPAGSREDLTWVVLVDVLPGNEVSGITFEQFNGTETDRRSIEAAIRRSSPLPTPPAPEIFERRLRLRYPASDPEAPIAKDESLPEALPIVRIDPQWPREALMDGTEGYVRCEVLIGPDGSVLDVRVIEAAPGRLFVRNVLRAVRRWKFKPQIVDGVAVKRWVETTIEFDLGS